MIFQDPMTSMNPVYTVGEQIVEAIRAHDSRVDKKRGARERAIELLDSVGHPRPGAPRRRLPARILRAACGSGR